MPAVTMLILTSGAGTMALPWLICSSTTTPPPKEVYVDASFNHKRRAAAMVIAAFGTKAIHVR